MDGNAFFSSPALREEAKSRNVRQKPPHPQTGRLTRIPSCSPSATPPAEPRATLTTKNLRRTKIKVKNMQDFEAILQRDLGAPSRQAAGPHKKKNDF